MTAMPCEKQLYIALIMAFFLVLPIGPFAFLAVTGFLPMPTALHALVDSVNNSSFAIAVMLWVCIPLQIVTTLLFLFTHYCSCFCVPSICVCCYKRKHRKSDGFFWIKKDLLDDFNEQVAEAEPENTNNEQETPLLNLIKYAKEKYNTEVKQKDLALQGVRLSDKRSSIEFTVWTKSRAGVTQVRPAESMKGVPNISLDNQTLRTKSYDEVIAMKTCGDVALDQKLGGYLLDLNGEVPAFGKFYVCHCDVSDNPETKLLVL